MCNETVCVILLRPDQDQSCSAKVLAQILVTHRVTEWFHGYIVVRLKVLATVILLYPLHYKGEDVAGLRFESFYLTLI